MSRRRPTITGQFHARSIELLESPAYRVLSVSGHRILDRVSIELAHHGGKDNGKLPVTYTQFEEYGIHDKGIAPALRECCALGLLVMTEQGRASAGEFRRPSLFRIPWLHSHKGEKPTNEWMRIETMAHAEFIARAARKAGEKPKKRQPVVGAYAPTWRANGTAHVMAGATAKNKKPGVVFSQFEGWKPPLENKKPRVETTRTAQGVESTRTSISRGGDSTALTAVSS
ncbi:hypothetical protein V1283_003440 [Bradyrhizobium sp. AZCC 2262]|uniref:hypothetical protein n=1 Tax=Bradyrhizobium sp. AZCC 2262 TaxID=3117022 RepID=UPI002FF17870